MQVQASIVAAKQGKKRIGNDHPMLLKAQFALHNFFTCFINTVSAPSRLTHGSKEHRISAQ
jgi:hypothetical protein